MIEKLDRAYEEGHLHELAAKINELARWANEQERDRPEDSRAEEVPGVVSNLKGLLRVGRFDIRAGSHAQVVRLRIVDTITGEEDFVLVGGDGILRAIS